MNPLAAKPPHFAPKAKSVIFLFMVGGPSQVDTFDPKPALEKYDGQPLPESYGKIVSQFTKGDTPLLRSPWDFQEVRPVRPRGIDAVPARRAMRGRYLLRPQLLHRQHGARAGDVPGAHGPHPDGLSEHGLVGHLRAGQRERQSAGLRRDAAAGRHARRRHAVLGRRVPAGGVPGDGVPFRAGVRSSI